ncbi:MAG: hypothetical protein VX498_11850, partial [Myxococcota bacterium]|nr:hypothetical protein [Myxococcota bacterium]
FEDAGLTSVYETLDISPDDLVLEGAALPFRWAGMNVTTPHKEAILGYVDTVDRNAQMAGAANLLYRNAQRAWTAGNTDGQGFINALQECCKESVAGKDIVILGAGGAARALGSTLVAARASCVHFVNRSLDRAEKVVREVGGSGAHAMDPKILHELSVSVDLVINTLPPQGDEFVRSLDLSPLRSDSILADINYFVDRPALLERGAEAGLRLMDGNSMFLWQAALSFHMWTGVQPDLELGRRLLDRLAGRAP